MQQDQKNVVENSKIQILDNSDKLKLKLLTLKVSENCVTKKTIFGLKREKERDNKKVPNLFTNRC